MLDRGESVFKGIEALRKYLGIKKFIIGIENNKPEAIANMKRLAAQTDGVTVHVLPAMYPQGGEKVLVCNTTKKIIPKGGLPLDVGVIVINVTTLAFIAEYLETGKPRKTSSCRSERRSPTCSKWQAVSKPTPQRCSTAAP